MPSPVTITEFASRYDHFPNDLISSLSAYCAYLGLFYTRAAADVMPLSRFMAPQLDILRFAPKIRLEESGLVIDCRGCFQEHFTASEYAARIQEQIFRTWEWPRRGCYVLRDGAIVIGHPQIPSIFTTFQFSFHALINLYFKTPLEAQALIDYKQALKACVIGMESEIYKVFSRSGKSGVIDRVVIDVTNLKHQQTTSGAWYKAYEALEAELTTIAGSKPAQFHRYIEQAAACETMIQATIDKIEEILAQNKQKKLENPIYGFFLPQNSASVETLKLSHDKVVIYLRELKQLHQYATELKMKQFYANESGKLWSDIYKLPKLKVLPELETVVPANSPLPQFDFR